MIKSERRKWLTETEAIGERERGRRKRGEGEEREKGKEGKEKEKEKTIKIKHQSRERKEKMRSQSIRSEGGQNGSPVQIIAGIQECCLAVVQREGLVTLLHRGEGRHSHAALLHRQPRPPIHCGGVTRLEERVRWNGELRQRKKKQSRGDLLRVKRETKR